MNKILLVTVLLAASIVLAGCGSSDSETASSTDTTTTEQTTSSTTESTETTTTAETTAPPPGPTVVRITVVDGAPQGGIVRKSVDKDERVVLVVTSDVADEIHLHGYDLSRDVAAGGTVRLRFRATIPGRFEVELEERGVQIADLTVNP